MITAEKTTITVRANINAPVEKVWSYWTDPKHIIRWNNASDDWYTPRAENDLRVGGKFNARMEARDGGDGFDFEGEYDSVVLLKQIRYTMSDGRSVRVTFDSEGENTTVTEVIETEQHNPLDIQQQGWQAILNNFKKYVERSSNTEMLHFEILIDASAEKVYTAMIDPKHYNEWTSEFNPTSQFKGSWEKGSKILFLGDAPDGSLGGMVSRIKENIPYRYISIEHLGIVENGKEVLCGPDVDDWVGAQENYTFIEKDGKTLLSVDTDTIEKYNQYFLNTWPKALQKLKSICESK
ncbi:MAG TPA: SRPBCC family protein [Bacteroidales bacterium]|jgi:uncharacterized protein YndB with AHSA1/START domain|nr:SRPBCC family protein [Bacteroidales bacterium]